MAKLRSSSYGTRWPTSPSHDPQRRTTSCGQPAAALAVCCWPMPRGASSLRRNGSRRACTARTSERGAAGWSMTPREVSPVMRCPSGAPAPRTGSERGADQRFRWSGLVVPLRPGHEVDQRFCWSEAIWWAWEDLNLRLHPYQQSTGNRCAADRLRRSHSTVGAEVKCSNGLQLSALPTRPESH